MMRYVTMPSEPHAGLSSRSDDADVLAMGQHQFQDRLLSICINTEFSYAV